MMIYNHMVSVVMITYNHENYIRQAIDGVLMQKTNFPVELIIANDHSPDNTDTLVKQIIDNYNGNIKIRYYNHAKNLGVSKNFKWALQQAQGKYIAICEGDDYWTDPYKLQKQVDFLEENEEFGLVATQADVFVQEKKAFIPKYMVKENKMLELKDIIRKNPIFTLTVMLKKDLIDEMNKLKRIEDFIFYDYSIWLYIAINNKLMIMNDFTGVYRILNNSLTNSKDYKREWKFKKQLLSNLQILIENTNKDTFNNILYKKNKKLYVLGCRLKDKTYCLETEILFKKNRDYIRYVILKLHNMNLIPITFLIIFERIIKNIKWKK